MKIFIALGIACTLFTACRKDEPGVQFASPNTSAESGTKKLKEPVEFYALTLNNSLHKYNTASPSDILASVTITGLSSGEKIRAIDFRPVNAQMYALGSNSNLYTINTSTGAATFVSALSVPLSGTSFGLDFNPVVDRIE